MNGKRKIEFNKSLYVNEFQLSVFENDKNFKEQLVDGKFGNFSKIIQFDEYCTNCACYNLLSDLSEEYPDDIEFFWCDESDTFGFIFKSESQVTKKLKRLGIIQEVKEKFCEILF